MVIIGLGALNRVAASIISSNSNNVATFIVTNTSKGIITKKVDDAEYCLGSTRKKLVLTPCCLFIWLFHPLIEDHNSSQY
jgi:hypothetical protein